MDAPYLQRLEASKFGCLDDVALDLTRIHALIGPNDSGKSTILNAARTLANLLSQVPVLPNPSRSKIVSGGLFDPDRPTRLAVSSGEVSLEVVGDERPTGWTLSVRMGTAEGSVRMSGDLTAEKLTSNLPSVSDPALLRGVFGGARLLRLDPDALREPSPLIPETEKLRLYDERGHGLPGIYDAIFNRGDDSVQRIVDDLRRLFPTIRRLRLRPITDSTKILEVELNHGERVPAQFMSEGLLYYLAFAAIPYLDPTSLLLIEEPENGLHPARIVEVMQTLREISKTTQVLIATHSPLVVNELSGDEVSVVTRTPDRGTQVRRLSTTPNFAERSKVYALGELWLSYANGSDEKDLLSPTQP
jgi:energy-coupling factor transporter ATP-binding protein EcfA2